ncbi:MAG: MFS transporter [Bacteroidetes bacterium]|nr:MFS transporter [Bacteroidota bacterium]
MRYARSDLSEKWSNAGQSDYFCRLIADTNFNMIRDKKNTSILLLLFVGVLMGALDISIVGPAIPSIEKTMHVGGRDLSWIYSIYILFNLVGISLMAKMSDTYGRRWIYVIAVAIFGLGSLVVSVSHDITLLLIGRAIQGFGSSGIFPVAIAVVGDIFPVEKRGRALGLIGAVFGIAFILGPFIAGFMLLYFDWNALFLINLPVAILLIFFAIRMLPSTRLEKKPVIDWAGIILMAVILTSFTLALNNIDTHNIIDSLGSWTVLPFIMLTVILTPILVMLEGHQQEPVLNIKLFNSTQVRIVGFIAFGLGLFQSTIVFLPKLAVDLFGVEPPKASFMLLPVVMATALGSPVGGRLVDKIGSKIIIISGLIIASVALFILSLLSKNLVLYYTAEAFLGFGLAMRASLSYIMLNEVPVKERASTQGILLIFISIGQLAGAALIGAIAAITPGKVSGFGIAFLVMTTLSGALVVLAFFLKDRKQELAGRQPI